MKRSLFGEDRPENADEITEALENAGLGADEVEAEISHDPWDANGGGDLGINMTGYTAEIRELESGDSPFTTCGFENKADLLAALKAAGIDELNDTTE